MKKTPDSFLTPYQRLLITSAIDCLQGMLNYDDKKSKEHYSRENTIREIEDALSIQPPPQPTRKNKDGFNALSKDDIDKMMCAANMMSGHDDPCLHNDEIDALLAPFREKKEDIPRDRLNKSEYKSNEFYSALDDLNKEKIQ
jgi:hypothetical protein